METQCVQRKISKLKLRIDPVLGSGSIRSEKKIKEKFLETMSIFKVDSCRHMYHQVSEDHGEDEGKK